MVMDMLGPDLETLFCFCGKGENEKVIRRRGDGDEELEDSVHQEDEDEEEEEKKEFSLKTVCMLAIEMVNRIEYVHSKGFIHRDIKPQNFLMGVGKKANTVYNIDFGLSKRYLDPKSGWHILYKEKASLAGTAMYLSLSAHMGREQSRRDDLESILYVVAYFLRKGSLPWMYVKAKKKERMQLQAKCKEENTPPILFEGFPQEFAEALSYVRRIGFDEKPNYNKLRSYFEKIMQYNGWIMDYEYDWIIKKRM